jgi:arylsulfatase A-like enzyme
LPEVRALNGSTHQINRRTFLRAVAAGAAAAGMTAQGAAEEDTPPNIVWIIVEDMSCHFGYQGETLVKTPHVDTLAARGVDFRRAHITCPVCSPSRSAMITGMYQTTIGAHNHRCSRGTVKYELPKHVRLLPDLFREAGYYVCNSNGLSWDKAGKTDYNFVFDAKLYDGSDWTKREPGQPFFAQIQLKGGKYGQTGEGRDAKVPEPVSPGDVKLPPYYPDHPAFREDWAQYLNAVMHTDEEVGHVMQRLEDEGIAGNTVIIFMTDHGISHVRGKQFLYEEGTHIPFIVWAPGRVPEGAVRDDFVAHIDMAATSLHFARIPIPEYMEARTLFGPDARPRDFVVSGRDRCDETVDRIRSVRKGDFKYIRNFYPKRPYLQPCAYKDAKLILKTIRALHAAGELNEVQSLIMAETRPQEELYDLSSDPHEIRNLADDSAHESTLKELRKVLDDWIRTSGDRGRRAEAPAMYDSDMKVYVDGMKRRGRTAYAETVERNIRLMKQWRDEGR